MRYAILSIKSRKGCNISLTYGVFPTDPPTEDLPSNIASLLTNPDCHMDGGFATTFTVSLYNDHTAALKALTT